jgi:hypothetical protein
VSILRIIRAPRNPAVGFSTTFAATENPLSQGGSWKLGATDGLDWLDWQSNGSVAYAAGFSADPAPPYNDAVALLKTSVFACTPNQFAEITVHVVPGYSPPSTHELGLFVRGNLSAHSMTGYESYLSIIASHTMVRWNGALNDFTPIYTGSPNVPVEDYVHRMEAIGNVISFYQNGVLISGGTDNTYATGQPGMQSFVAAGGTPASYSVKSFRCGNL